MNEETATEMTSCEKFLEGIVHPNERILAREIMEGKRKEGEFSLSFDQAQIDTMVASLAHVECEFDVSDGDTTDEEIEEKEEEVIGKDTDTVDEATDTDTAKDVTDEVPTEPEQEPGETTAEIPE